MVVIESDCEGSSKDETEVFTESMGKECIVEIMRKETEWSNKNHVWSTQPHIHLKIPTNGENMTVPGRIGHSLSLSPAVQSISKPSQRHVFVECSRC